MIIPQVGGYADFYHRYYWQGVGPMPGVTSILKLQDALINGDLAAWGGGIAADAVLGEWVRHPDPRHAEVDGSDIRAEALKAVSAKRDIGSAVHGKIEDLLSGKVWTRTPETGLYLDGFSLFMAEHHPEFIATEQMVISLKHGYGGRFDFIGRIRKRIAMVDVKTGSLKKSHALQLGLYSDRSAFIARPNDDTKYPLPRIQDYYVLLLREGSYELVPMKVGSAERKHSIRLVRMYREAKAWEARA